MNVFAGAPAIAVLMLAAVTFAGVARAVHAAVAHCVQESDGKAPVVGLPPTTPTLPQFIARPDAIMPVHGGVCAPRTGTNNSNKRANFFTVSGQVFQTSLR